MVLEFLVRDLVLRALYPPADGDAGFMHGIGIA
jgi:hypothetical protein